MKLSNSAYVRNFLLSTLIFVGVIASFNFIVDPYGLFRIVDIEGFNTLKPEFNRNLIHSKTAAIRYVKPESIILGTSRANQGYDPDHPGWGDEAPYPRFNLGTPAANIYRMYRLVQHSQSVQPLKQIIFALDFFSFNAYRANDGGIDSYVDVSYEGKPQPFAHLKGLFPAFISFDAISSSFKTIGDQDLDKVQSTYFFNGFQYKAGRAYQNRVHYLRGCARFVKSVYFPPPRRLYDFYDAQTQRDSFALFRELVSMAYTNQIDLRFAINPPHAYLMEVISRANIWDKFEEWKRALVDINEEEAARHNAEPYPIWDFSGYNSVTTQEIPDEQTLDTGDFYYHEASHFKALAGDMILDRVLDYQDSEREVPDDFGVRLTSESIEQHLAQIRADRRFYRRTHAEEVNDVKEVIEAPLKLVRRVQRGARENQNTLEESLPTED
ncbi:hypothetical protein [Leptolyngbya sp. CCY15150]|uniref:hypothetical protein n=1 Tax=Leptolyngbya sp. CCY15150 TaxID=2767772 RepID=UPI00195005CD|nr:hypothetical protein [Leptolyngbya sp. CCY15150]